MGNLIGLELRKNNFKPFLLAVLGIFVATIVLGVLFCAVPTLEPNDPASQMFQSPDMVWTMTSIISMSAYGILCAVMYARLVVEEYTGQKNVLLFTYPQKRSRILLAKCGLTFGFVFVLMLASNLVACVLIGWIGALLGLLPAPFQSFVSMAGLTVVLALVANVVGMIALRVGFYKKSVVTSVVTATILVSPFGNIVSLFGEDAMVTILAVAVVLVLAGGILFGGLLRRVNRMECL